ncbi:chromosome partitioning protein, ParB family [Spirosomataceae bacterium TFI 002]|nr:chromosome partitioning protein, ParB family [Spirosomataceae bacterium TFI 002]
MIEMKPLMQQKKKIVRKGLGRGLDALLAGSSTESVEQKEQHVQEKVEEKSDILLSDIEVNPFQPRKQFDKLALMELSQSIRQQGIIQPITVRSIGDGKYQLISGERRLQASKLAGLKSITAHIISVNDQVAMEMALIENIQREDLNAIEIAESYQQVMEVLELTQEELSVKVGKDRATISNYLRLLKLPSEIREGVKDGLISMGHARSLVGVSDTAYQLILFNKIQELHLSVRDTENNIKAFNAKKNAVPTPKKVPTRNSNQIELGNTLGQYFGKKVTVALDAKSKGQIKIAYENIEELESIIEKLKKA